MSDDAYAPARCLNCGHALPPPGAFCPRCGQPPAHRLSTAHVAHELLHVFTHADKGILAYLPALLLRPGRLVADYRAGRRKRYFNPFQFLLLSAALATLLVNQWHLFDDLATLQNLNPNLTPAELARAHAFYHGLSHYYNLVLLLLIPFNALLARLVYRRQGVNYAEAFFMNVVSSSANTLYSLLLFVGLGLAHRSVAQLNVVQTAVVVFTYFSAIGHTALGLRWPAAVGKAALFFFLLLLLNTLLNKAAFALYMALG